MDSLVETPEYQAAISLLGPPRATDELLAALLLRISVEGAIQAAATDDGIRVMSALVETAAGITQVGIRFRCANGKIRLVSAYLGARGFRLAA